MKPKLKSVTLTFSAIPQFFTLALYILNFTPSFAQEEAICPQYSCPSVICDLKKKDVQNFCDTVKCVGIHPENCSVLSEHGGRYMYEEHLSMCGCCPGCVKYFEIGEPCDQHPPDPSPDPDCDPSQFICPILMHRCAPGLTCPLVGPNEKKCSYKTGDSGFSDLTSCPDKLALALNGDLHWTPDCEIDGSYKPKQCKGTYGNGICFCVSKEGNRIFGTQYRNQAQNQTCACSRQVHQLRESGHIASFHCTEDGNYEALQCDTESGLCYCVDEKTGQLNGAVLPESQWKSLPCFSYNLTNWDTDGGYYRKCESDWAVSQKLSLEASLHGLQVLSGRRVSCDFDGSYAPVQNIEETTKCVQKDGSLFGGFSDMEGKFPNTNCQCVRDEIKAILEGVPFTKACESVTGNYDYISRLQQTEPIIWQCVDRDGFFFGSNTTDEFKCCLYGTLVDPNGPKNCDGQPEEIKRRCVDPNDPIVPCYNFPQ